MIRGFTRCTMLAACVALFALPGCTPDQGMPIADGPTRDSATRSADPADDETSGGEAPGETIFSGIVTFLVGEAAIREDSQEWVPLDIGDAVSGKSAVRVEPESYVDIQFGTLATVRLEPETIVSIPEIAIDVDSRRATIEVVAGSVLNRVDRLTGRDSYKVQTDTAIAGVRGTDFGVVVAQDGRTFVAVKAGNVSVVPRWTQEIESLADEIADPEVEQLVRSLSIDYHERFIVSADQQATFDESSNEAARAAIESFTVAVRDYLSDPSDERETELQELRDLRSRADAVAEDERPIRIAPQTSNLQEILERIDVIQRLHPSTSSGEIAPTGAEQARVRVVVSPADAIVYAQEASVGSSTFAGVYPVGSTLIVEAYADGYEPYFQEIEITDAGLQVIELVMERSPEPETVPEIVPEPAPAPESPPGSQTQREPEPAPEAVATSEPARSEPTFEPVLHDVVVRATPSNAAILVDGRRVGRGRYAGRFEAGESLNVEVELAGYESERRTVIVPGEATEFGFILQASRRTVAVEATPRDAVILLDGRVVATGRYSGTHEVGSRLHFDVRAAAHVDEQFIVDVPPDGDTHRLVALERARKTVRVAVEPADAVLYVDGTRVATGSYELVAPVGEHLSFRAERGGYASAEIRMTVSGDGNAPVRISLEPRPIEMRASVGTGMLVRGIAIADELLVAVDRNGTMFGVAPDGSVRWSVATANNPNENSLPVFAAGRVYLSGAAEFVGVDAGHGTEILRRNLDSEANHLFGRRVVPGGERLYFPTNHGIDVLDRSGDLIESISVSGNVSMTPALVNHNLVIVDQSGIFLVYNTTGDDPVRKVQTDVTQPVAVAPAVADGVAYVVGRRGTVAAVEVASASVLWQTPLEPDRSMGSYVDPVVGTDGVYVFARNTLYALNRADGSRRFPPVEGVTSPPLVFEGRLVYGDDEGRLVLADAATGNVLAWLNLGALVTTRPAVWNGRFAVGLETGELVVVNEEGIVFASVPGR